MAASLGGAKETREVVRRHRLQMKKKFGQNFLIDEGVLQQIVEASDLTKEDCVLEIGPGIGTLTQYLAEKAGSVVAVEIDRTLIPVLEETLADYGNVTIRNEDILKTDLQKIMEEKNEGNPLKVVANLPYYITTPIIMKLLEKEPAPASLTVMVQKELAQRMCAGPGGKDYGELSLAVQYYAEPEFVCSVPATSFLPAPKVESAVISLRKRQKAPVVVKDRELLFRMIREAFGQRRKTLVNSLSGSFPKEKIKSAIALLGKPENIRGEALTLEEFAGLSEYFQKNQ